MPDVAFGEVGGRCKKGQEFPALFYLSFNGCLIIPVKPSFFEWSEFCRVASKFFFGVGVAVN